MNFPFNQPIQSNTNELLRKLLKAQSTCEAKLRVPMHPEELKRMQKMFEALTAAVAIVEKTEITHLTQQ
ncbi:hypothetical protein TDB9533_04619 [Thalassocella blandensis]|nr:hypothetical protein TDB9533_04619 [Thalassocella blandensis]